MTTKDGIKHKPKEDITKLPKDFKGQVEACCGLKKKLSELIDDSEATMECFMCKKVGE